ncbi:hypothetical protein PTTG_26286 [Puccinia triticina 1-1 BBBD Race 1]|uniref:ATP-dependent DNA helicase n=1 Tax=Puccinia triticina (isolate 1-1 / race 1 (BBBD)) TaxID=630390 RepID=A0A180GUZ6_PUCT1|nr:hypothetical protein PTTG_26286 [Puccinia triticina 1-1 BBBD Race 1]
MTSSKSGKLRLLLSPGPPACQQKLFKDHFYNLGDDVVFKLGTRYSVANPTQEEIRGLTLWLMSQTLAEMNACFQSVGLKLSCKDQFLMEMFDGAQDIFDFTAISARLEKNEMMFTLEQRVFFNGVMYAVNNQVPPMFYLDGPGGTDDLIRNPVKYLYGDIKTECQRTQDSYMEYLSSRCILTPLNMNVEVLTSILVDKPDNEALDLLAKESLSKLDFPGFPEHSLSLAVGMPVMLLQNLNIPQGLCNRRWTMGANISTGSHKGKEVTLTKITLWYKGEAQDKISCYCNQFPVVAYFNCM